MEIPEGFIKQKREDLLRNYFATQPELHNPNVLERLLCTSIRCDSVNCAKYLLDQGANPNGSRGVSIGTPLCIAIWNGNIELVKLMMEYGGVINSICMLPIYEYQHPSGAITNTNKHKNIIQYLCEKNPDMVHLVEPRTKRTALHYISSLFIIQVLLEYGADPSKKCNMGLTPLHIAAEENNKEWMKLLLDFGSDPNATTPKGLNFLDIITNDEVREEMKDYLMVMESMKIKEPDCFV